MKYEKLENKILSIRDESRTSAEILVASNNVDYYDTFVKYFKEGLVKFTNKQINKINDRFHNDCDYDVNSRIQNLYDSIDTVIKNNDLGTRFCFNMMYVGNDVFCNEFVFKDADRLFREIFRIEPSVIDREIKNPKLIIQGDNTTIKLTIEDPIFKDELKEKIMKVNELGLNIDNIRLYRIGASQENNLINAGSHCMDVYDGKYILELSLSNSESIHIIKHEIKNFKMYERGQNYIKQLEVKGGY